MNLVVGGARDLVEGVEPVDHVLVVVGGDDALLQVPVRRRLADAHGERLVRVALLDQRPCQIDRPVVRRVRLHSYFLEIIMMRDINGLRRLIRRRRPVRARCPLETNPCAFRTVPRHLQRQLIHRIARPTALEGSKIE